MRSKNAPVIRHDGRVREREREKISYEILLLYNNNIILIVFDYYITKFRARVVFLREKN